MVVKMIKWRPWPPPSTKKYDVRLLVKTLRGCEEGAAEDRKFAAEIRWRGPKLALMSSLRRAPVKRNFTREEGPGEDGVVVWEEEFQTVCGLTAYKENVFHHWEIGFTVFDVTSQGSKSKIPIIGSSLINLAEFASVAEQKEFELSIPLICPATPAADSESPPLLSIVISLEELQAVAEASDSVQRQVVPITSPPQSGEAASASGERQELSALKTRLQKVKIISEYVSSRKAKKDSREEEGSEEKCSGQSEDDELSCPIDSDCLDDSEEVDSLDESKEGPSARKSFRYGPLAYANYVGGSLYSNANNMVGEYEDWVYYSNRKSDEVPRPAEDLSALVSEELQLQSSKRRILSWRKRKLSFRSPKRKGEPLLKKAYAEEGGDDIDFDRRQLSSDESNSQKPLKLEECVSSSPFSEFGDDNFAIGSWEQKEIRSRDGHMKLEAQVFFASIDQRSERAAGESACTALVAVIADWFQKNPNLMPIKSQFDSLIREGSSEWRSLCENERYREQFPDKHFDLETVVEAHIRPLSVVPGKSFIGFFHPEDGASDGGRFDFLEGSLSFENIWDEISRVASNCSSNGDPQVFIVSWNDHFFVLKVEPEAYYIIDTLGERLHEGCDQAYILKFDSNSSISRVPPSEEEKSTQDPTASIASSEVKKLQPEQGDKVHHPEPERRNSEETGQDNEPEIICRGKESCKEYIKNFLAAIPIRELQADIQKGLMGSTPLHQRLQIEFHYTQLWQPPVTAPVVQATPEAARPFEALATTEVAVF